MSDHHLPIECRNDYVHDPQGYGILVGRNWLGGHVAILGVREEIDLYLQGVLPTDDVKTVERAYTGVRRDVAEALIADLVRFEADSDATSANIRRESILSDLDDLMLSHRPVRTAVLQRHQSKRVM